MAISKLTDISTYLPSIYEDALFVAREMNLMSNLVFNYTGTGFMIRYVPVRPEITAQTIADGVDFNNPTTWNKSSGATLTPGEIIAQALLTDQHVETDFEDAVRTCSLELGGAISTKIDVDLVGLFSSLSEEKGPGAGNALTYNYIAAAYSIVSSNCKVAGPMFVVWHPYQWFDIWVELGSPAATYPNLHDMTTQALRDYWIGNWMGMQWFTSNNIAIITGDDAVGAVFHREALALDTRRAPRLEPERDASQRATELNMTAGYAYGVRRSTYGVYITSDVTDPAGS
jgi:hypothetical protein